MHVEITKNYVINSHFYEPLLSSIITIGIQYIQCVSCVYTDQIIVNTFLENYWTLTEFKDVPNRRDCSIRFIFGSNGITKFIDFSLWFIVRIHAWKVWTVININSLLMCLLISTWKIGTIKLSKLMKPIKFIRQINERKKNLRLLCTESFTNRFCRLIHGG